jgi:hypothetical protein
MNRLVLTTLAAIALLFLVQMQAAFAGDVYASAELRRLLTGTKDPLPNIPVVVRQIDSRAEVDALISSGFPAVFQISQATGPYASPEKVAFFEIVGAHFFLRANWKKIAANSEAAWALYDRPVTKPVYIIFDPTQVGPARFKVWDESVVGDFDVDDLEDAIKVKLHLDPVLVSPTPLTEENEHRMIFEWRPDFPNPGPTARWITILFYNGTPALSGLRDELGLDRFLYRGDVRFAEVDLTNPASRGVFKILTGAEPSNDGELLIYDPDTKNFALYTSGDPCPKFGFRLPPLAEMTHEVFMAWLWGNDVKPPKDRLLNSEYAWSELKKLKGREEGMLPDKQVHRP